MPSFKKSLIVEQFQGNYLKTLLKNELLKYFKIRLNYIKNSSVNDYNCSTILFRLYVIWSNL